ncbi:MAG: anthranilate phosphoribosyltransferase [Dissulfurimicrobium sp.]|uniref:anthranilate phosphoribosyltransferase n=1 Tax=Dissulfurimicrobium sp. TaxID=2022436 RepID=UPI0040495C11
MDAIKRAIARLADKKDLSEAEIYAVMERIMAGESTPAQIGAILVGLRMKGETVEEITGAARAMRKNALAVSVKLASGEHLVDTCGTGGDSSNTFNISTTTAFVVAGAGVKVAKHGNRSVSSRSGSADCLEALGVNLAVSKETVARMIEEIGIGFLFAPFMHPAMKYVIGPRRELGIRTIFNILGPLTNPAGADIQLMGVYDPGLTRCLAEVLGRLGSFRAWVVHGAGRLDELSLIGETSVSEWDGRGVSSFKIWPEDAGLRPCRPDELKGGDARENAEILRGILSGEERGPKRDIVLLNAGAAIYLAGRAHDLKDGVSKAQESIDSGRALAVLRSITSFDRETDQ